MERLKLHFMIAVLKLLLKICWRIDGYGSPLVNSKDYNYAEDITKDLQEEMNKLI
jgi:hypothetical protein